MFYENEVMRFLRLQEKIQKQQRKATTLKNQQRLSCLINEKEKIKKN